MLRPCSRAARRPGRRPEWVWDSSITLLAAAWPVRTHTVHGHGLAFDSTALTACFPAPEKPVEGHFQNRIHVLPSASQASQRLRGGEIGSRLVNGPIPPPPYNYGLATSSISFSQTAL